MCPDSASPSLTEMSINRCDSAVCTATRHRASLHLLDWLGCVLAGQASETGKSLRRYSQQNILASGVAFAATGPPLSALEAAFTNGGLGNLLEMDDLHRQSLLHTGDTVIPAALALAQEVSASMEELLDAIVKGYEVAIHIGLVASSSGYSAWYNSSTCGVFGAGMAASVLLKLSKEQTRDALAQCGMMASGLWQCRLEPGASKQLATAHAARSGVMAAMLAASSFPGPKHILEGKLGFFKTLYPESTINTLTVCKNQPWKITEVSFKPWPACRHTHPVIEAALALSNKLDANKIRSIEIGSYRSAIDFCDNARPGSDHEARFSLQYCVASALVRGNPELAHFDKQSRADSTLRSLIDVTNVVENADLQQAFPGLFGGRVAVKLADGNTHSTTVTSAKGDPENPMHLDEIRHKFSRLSSSARVSSDSVEAVLSLLAGDTLADNLDTLNEQLSAIANQLEKHRHAT